MNMRQTIDAMSAAYPVKKRHDIAGLKISVETPKGDTRSGKDKNGHEWSIKMQHDYGYIRMTEGEDGEHVDCYVGPNPEAPNVFIVHQNDPDSGEYDEDKCMIGFDSAKEAKQAYLDHYDRPGFFGSMDEVTMEEFKELVLATKESPGRIEAMGNLANFNYHGSWPIGMDARPSFGPPSLKNRQRVPIDDPIETDDRFLDVTKRNDPATKLFRAKLTMKKGYPVPIQRVGQQPSQNSAMMPLGSIINWR